MAPISKVLNDCSRQLKLESDALKNIDREISTYNKTNFEKLNSTKFKRIATIADKALTDLTALFEARKTSTQQCLAALRQATPQQQVAAENTFLALATDITKTEKLESALLFKIANLSQRLAKGSLCQESAKMEPSTERLETLAKRNEDPNPNECKDLRKEFAALARSLENATRGMKTLDAAIALSKSIPVSSEDVEKLNAGNATLGRHYEGFERDRLHLIHRYLDLSAKHNIDLIPEPPKQTREITLGSAAKDLARAGLKAAWNNSDALLIGGVALLGGTYLATQSNIGPDYIEPALTRLQTGAINYFGDKNPENLLPANLIYKSLAYVSQLATPGVTGSVALAYAGCKAGKFLARIPSYISQTATETYASAETALDRAKSYLPGKTTALATTLGVVVGANLLGVNPTDLLLSGAQKVITHGPAVIGAVGSGLKFGRTALSTTHTVLSSVLSVVAKAAPLVPPALNATFLTHPVASTAAVASAASTYRSYVETRKGNHKTAAAFGAVSSLAMGTLVNEVLTPSLNLTLSGKAMTILAGATADSLVKGNTWTAAIAGAATATVPFAATVIQNSLNEGATLSSLAEENPLTLAAMGVTATLLTAYGVKLLAKKGMQACSNYFKTPAAPDKPEEVDLDQLNAAQRQAHEAARKNRYARVDDIKVAEDGLDRKYSSQEHKEEKKEEKVETPASEPIARVDDIKVAEDGLDRKYSSQEHKEEKKSERKESVFEDSLAPLRQKMTEEKKEEKVETPASEPSARVRKRQRQKANKQKRAQD